MTSNEVNDSVLSEVVGPLGYLTLNRPERRNAIDNAMVDCLMEKLKELELNPAVRVIIVRGAGLSFCAGWDLTAAVDELHSLDTEDELQWIDVQLSYFERLWRSRKPTIAQVQGHCLAGGGTLAAFCDLIVAADDAYFGQPEARDAGYPPELCLWPITIGPRLTKEFLMTGELIRGDRAERIGMVNHAVPAEDLERYTAALGQRIAQTHPQMLNYSKRLVNQVFDVMGVRSMWDLGTYVDYLGHHSDAMAQFVVTRNEHGLKAALNARDGLQRLDL